MRCTEGSMANIVANNLLGFAFAFNAHARSNLILCCVRPSGAEAVDGCQAI
jgi:hypothetical protein